MANADRPSSPANAPLSRAQSRLLLLSFLVITIALAFFAASAIIEDSQDPVLQQRIEGMRERKSRNSLFAPTDTTNVPVSGAPDSTTGR
jgi:hypothetical protein